MKEIVSNKMLFYNEKTGQREPVDLLRGESAYEAAVRLGQTTLSEEEWLEEYNANRDAAISAINARQAEATQAVASAGATQVNSIAAKGAETLATIPEDYAKLSSDVATLTEDIEQLKEDVGITEEILLDFAADKYLIRFSGLSILRNIPMSGRMKAVEFQTLKTGTYDVDISFWTLNDDVFTRLHTQNFTGEIVNGYFAINPDFVSNEKYYIGLYANSEIYGYSTPGTNNIVSSTERSAETLTTSSSSQYLPQCKVTVAKVYGENSIEVHVGDGFEYSQIQEALDDNENAEYLTIYLHPSEKPYTRFSTMRKLDGAYPWSGIMCKHISIIGLDKEKCIVQDDSGNYDTPPAEIATNGVIENIRFIATHENSTEDFVNASYAVHVDNRPLDAAGYHLVFKNCDFVSYQAPAVGLGVYANQHIEFIGCNLITDAALDYQPNPDYRLDYANIGAFFMHTSMEYAEGNEKLTIKNSKIISVQGDYSLKVNNSDKAEGFIVEAIGNTLWAGGANDVGVYFGGVTTLKKPYNHGNNASALNG